jgi:acyl carrier protein
MNGEIVERDAFCKGISEFITGLAEKRIGGPVAAAIGEDANLFDLGLVDSFTIIQMIVYLEELTGISIDLSAHDLESFYTIRGIYALVQGADEGGTA